jgi:putative transposase
MITILSALVSLLSFRVRSRASLELELVALRHQVTVLRRRRPGQLRLFSIDRLPWVWLYRVWPQVLNTMVLVKPATVVQWHRKGFRLSWRWRSRRLGRPQMSTEIRDLIRQTSLVNPLWGPPHPRRTAQARHRGQPSHGRETPAVAAQSPLPNLA